MQYESVAYRRLERYLSGAAALGAPIAGPYTLPNEHAFHWVTQSPRSASSASSRSTSGRFDIQGFLRTLKISRKELGDQSAERGDFNQTVQESSRQFLIEAHRGRRHVRDAHQVVLI